MRKLGPCLAQLAAKNKHLAPRKLENSQLELTGLLEEIFPDLLLKIFEDFFRSYEMDRITEFLGISSRQGSKILNGNLLLLLLARYPNVRGGKYLLNHWMVFISRNYIR